MGGGGKGGEAVTPQEIENLSNQLTAIAESQLATGLPALQEGGQIADALLRGDVSRFRGVINPQIEAARAAGSQQVRAAEEQAARLGLTGTGLQEALANARFAAELGPSQIAAAPALSALQTGAGTTFALPGQAIQGLSGAGQLAGQGTVVTPEQGGLAGGIGGALGGGLGGLAAGAALAPATGGGSLAIPIAAALLGGTAGGVSGAK